MKWYIFLFRNFLKWVEFYISFYCVESWQKYRAMAYRFKLLNFLLPAFIFTNSRSRMRKMEFLIEKKKKKKLSSTTRSLCLPSPWWQINYSFRFPVMKASLWKVSKILTKSNMWNRSNQSVRNKAFHIMTTLFLNVHGTVAVSHINCSLKYIIENISCKDAKKAQSEMVIFLFEYIVSSGPKFSWKEKDVHKMKSCVTLNN